MRKLIVAAGLAVLAIGLTGAPASAGSAATVKADNFDFEPRKVAIGQGETVTWKNKEGKHTVTFKDFNYDKTIDGDDKVSKTFKDTGVFKYICRFHREQDMKGKVIVGDV